MTTTKAVYPRLLDVEGEVDPIELPVDLADVKAFLRVDGADQDGVITALIAAATQWAEGYTRSAFVTRRYAVRFAAFPPPGCDMQLIFSPVQSPLIAVAYVQDAVNVPLVIGTDVAVEPSFGYVREVNDFTWPQGVDFVDVIYDAGYGAAADVPDQIKQAIQIAVAQMFMARTDQVVGTIVSSPQVKASTALLDHFRRYQF